MDINFLWIGESIDKMGQLSLKSFLDHDHSVKLWSYNNHIQNIPSGVILKDAREILEENKVFSYKGKGDCRNNSYGGFSDIFRYHLLNKVGGWYCDMDVTCLKNFSNISDSEYVIRPHNIMKYVANIFKAPQNDNFLKHCIEETEKNVNENNDRWVLPLDILKNTIDQFDLGKYVAPVSYFGNDDIDQIFRMLEIPFKNQIQIPEYAIHWCNEAVCTGQWCATIKRNWNAPVPTTYFYKLLKKHKLL